MMTCRYCWRVLEESAFNRAVTIRGRVYRRRKCRACEMFDRVRRKLDSKEWLKDYKKGRSCERCGFSDYRALEFHHRDGDEKDFNVSDMVQMGLSVARIAAEIAKCEVLCANCHRILHFVAPRSDAEPEPRGRLRQLN